MEIAPLLTRTRHKGRHKKETHLTIISIECLEFRQQSVDLASLKCFYVTFKKRRLDKQESPTKFWYFQHIEKFFSSICKATKAVEAGLRTTCFRAIRRPGSRKSADPNFCVRGLFSGSEAPQV